MQTQLLSLFAVAAFASVSLAGNHCQHLFHHRQAIVHHVAPQVFYFAGQSTQDEALVRKVVREEIRQALQSPQQQTAATSGAFAAKCAKCHKGDNALTSDPSTFKAFARMAGLGDTERNAGNYQQPYTNGKRRDHRISVAIASRQARTTSHDSAARRKRHSTLRRFP